MQYNEFDFFSFTSFLGKWNEMGANIRFWHKVKEAKKRERRMDTVAWHKGDMWFMWALNIRVISVFYVHLKWAMKFHFFSECV